jgi:hypothetical protein
MTTHLVRLTSVRAIGAASLLAGPFVVAAACGGAASAVGPDGAAPFDAAVAEIAAEASPVIDAQSDQTPDTVDGATPSGPPCAWAVGNAGAMLSYDGVAWTAHPGVSGQQLGGVWGRARDDVWAVGDHETILHYDGASWTSKYGPGTDFSVTGAWGSARDDVWAAASFSTILHYDGTAWTSQTDGRLDTINAIWGSGPTDVWAVGENTTSAGRVLHYDGKAWNFAAATMPTPLTGVWGTGPTDVWAVGIGAGIFHYDGQTWSALPDGLPDGAVPDYGEFGVSGSAPDDVWAIGAAATTTFLHYDGSSWSSAVTTLPPPLGPSIGVWALWSSARDQVWTVGGSGANGGSGFVLRFDGAAWGAMKVPASPGLRAVWGVKC